MPCFMQIQQVFLLLWHLLSMYLNQIFNGGQRYYDRTVNGNPVRQETRGPEQFYRQNDVDHQGNEDGLNPGHNPGSTPALTTVNGHPVREETERSRIIAVEQNEDGGPYQGNNATFTQTTVNGHPIREETEGGQVIADGQDDDGGSYQGNRINLQNIVRFQDHNATPTRTTINGNPVREETERSQIIAEEQNDNGGQGHTVASTQTTVNGNPVREEAERSQIIAGEQNDGSGPYQGQVNEPNSAVVERQIVQRNLPILENHDLGFPQNGTMAPNDVYNRNENTRPYDPGLPHLIQSQPFESDTLPRNNSLSQPHNCLQTVDHQCS